MTPDTHAAGPADQGERLQTRPGEPCLIRVTAAETNGACSVVEILSHPDDSTPIHVHQNEDEHFLILEATPRFVRGSESSDCSQQGSSVAEGHFEAVDHLQQGAGSSLVRRLVLAKDDPAKQRMRVWLSDVNDERLLRFGLTFQDIAALRGTVNRPAEMTIAQELDAPAGCPFPTDEVNMQNVTLETHPPCAAIEPHCELPPALSRSHPEDSPMTTLLDKQRPATSNANSADEAALDQVLSHIGRARADGRAARSRH